MLASDAGVSLRLELSTNIAPVPMLESQIEQVLIILIDDAIDTLVGQRGHADAAARLPAVIDLGKALAEDAGAVVVAVRGSGPALPRARAQRVVDPPHTAKINGVGFGLSIAPSVIEAHGGRSRALQRHSISCYR